MNKSDVADYALIIAGFLMVIAVLCAGSYLVIETPWVPNCDDCAHPACRSDRRCTGRYVR